KNGTYTKLASTSGTSINHNVYRANSLNYIKIRTYVKQTNKVITSAFSSPVGIFPLSAPTGFNYSINSAGNLAIKWKAVPNAQRYHIYYSTSKNGTYTRYGSTTATSKTLTGMPKGIVYIKLVAQRTDGSVNSYSAYSSAFQCNTNPRQFRALHVFIERDGVNPPMVVGNADMRRMNELYKVATPYGLAPSLVLDKRNLTKSQLFAQIASMASMADSNDITYFSLSCHGYSGKSTGVVAGQMRLAGGTWINIYELADELKKIPGQVIIQLNACGSGAAILAAGEEAEPFDGEAFEDEIIEAFARADEECIAEAGGAVFGDNMVEDAHGEMRVYGKFYVITHCEAGKTGVYYTNSSQWGQFLTRWMRSAVLSDSITISGGLNYNYRTKSLGSYAADTNGDKIITLKEMGAHLKSLGNYFGYFEVDGEYTNLMPQIYPENSTFQLFKKR
ncbi:MAG: fibronectin type III domain-containing protein, partial [Clostridia bacterium]|nr:fibronectin type III domain-containing protein [Clostridia bacterium]